MKKAVALILILCILCSALCACGSNSEDALPGTWKNTQSTANINEITFYSDGTCRISHDNALFDWAIVNGNQLKLSAYTTVYVWEFDISGNTLTLIENGQTATFEKAS